MSGRPINQDRATSVELGYPTYIGMEHSACGTSERYTKGGACVHCARIIATEQRAARKYLAHHALDNAPEMAIEESEADRRARIEASIDELM